MTHHRAVAQYMDFLDIDVDPCPYCGAMNGFTTPGYCQHLLSLSVEDELLHVSDDFVRVVDQVFGFPDIVAQYIDWKAFLMERAVVPTKRAGVLSVGDLVKGVEDALLEAGIELTIGDAQAIKPYHAVYISEPLDARFTFTRPSIQERARELFASVYLDDTWYVEADREKDGFADFYRKAHDLHERVKAMTDPLEALLLYVNKKRSLCLRFGQTYTNRVDDFALFELDNYKKRFDHRPEQEEAEA